MLNREAVAWLSQEPTKTTQRAQTNGTVIAVPFVFRMTDQKKKSERSPAKIPSMEVAASWLNEQPAWTAEVATLRENTFRARNRASYAHTRPLKSPIVVAAGSPASLKTGESVRKKDDKSW